MTWKFNKLIRLTLLSLCSLAFSLFLCSSSAFAVDSWVTGYYNNSWHTFEYQGRHDLPYDAVPYSAYSIQSIYGMRVEQYGSYGNSSVRYNKINVSLTLFQSVNSNFGYNSFEYIGEFSSPSVSAYLITSDDIMYRGDCTSHYYREKAVYSCSILAPDYKSSTYIGIDLGDISYPDAGDSIRLGDIFGYHLPGTFDGSLQMWSFSYNVESSDDPLASGIQSLVDQNGVIISQNNQMIELLDGNTEAINNQTEQLLGALNNQTSQEHSDYEAEKEEESERESDLGDSADEVAGIFSFTSFNPFSPIFELFGDGSGCVNIPTLSSWLHVSQTQVCPFFPSSVRNVVTPILGISSMMIIFGFFVRWLKNSSGDNDIVRSDDTYYG